MKPSVLFLLPYPLHQAPSQRFRVEAYFPLLEQHNIPFRNACFLDKKGWDILYKKGSLIQKAWSIAKGYLKRTYQVLFIAPGCDTIFIHREAAPLGPPFFEWWLAKIYRKKIVYDFDDAIWIPNVSESNRVARLVKCFWKVPLICRWSSKISAGNDFLGAFAGKYNPNVIYNPTCVDMEQKYNQLAEQDTDQPVIGWTGSHSTIQFLAVGILALKKLEETDHVRYLFICDKEPEFGLKSQEFLKWKEETEITDLLKMQIGIMPLKNDQWSEGKCGFKLIQYLSLGIPALASPVGVNSRIIEHGVNGYLCETDEEWVVRLRELKSDVSKRKLFGKNGREKMQREFSISSNADNFLSLFLN